MWIVRSVCNVQYWNNSVALICEKDVGTFCVNYPHQNLCDILCGYVTASPRVMGILLPTAYINTVYSVPLFCVTVLCHYSVCFLLLVLITQ